MNKEEWRCKMTINLTKEEAEYLENLLYFAMESTEQTYEFMDVEQKKKESIQYQLNKNILQKIQGGAK